MKKSVFVFLFIFASLLCFSKETEISREPCEFKEVSLFEGYMNSFISRKEFYSDLNHLCYILSCGYAGYEDMVLLGFNQDDFKKKVEDEFKNQNEIETRKFYFALKNALIPYMNDAHFQLVCFYDSHSFCEKSICYWSNIFVQYKDDSYFVYESGKKVEKGEKYLGDLENLFYYPAKGENVFRLGKISSENLSETEFNFENAEEKSHKIKAELFNDGQIEVRPMKYKEFETSDSAYIAMNSFSLPSENDSFRRAAEIVFEEFSRSGKKYNAKKNIIVDIRTNGGGDATVPALFLHSLYSNNPIKNLAINYRKANNWFSDFFKDFDIVYSPVSVQANFLLAEIRGGVSQNDISRYFSTIEKLEEKPEKIVLREDTKKSNLFNGKCKFDGKLILLTDRNTKSAAECFVFMAKEVFGDEKVFVIGENTSGMSTYWNLVTLRLPNSGIGVHTAFGRNHNFEKFSDWHGEGFGIYPDYWTCGSDLNETIFLATQDEEMKEKLKPQMSIL